jgi:hypothetical protein
MGDCDKGRRAELVGSGNRVCRGERFDSDAEMNRAALAALDGDGPAAYRLSEHFLAIGRFDQADRWLQVAVANGDRSAAYGLALALSEAQDNCKKRRAASLLRRLVVNNDPIAREAASQLNYVNMRLPEASPSDCRLLGPTYQR